MAQKDLFGEIVPAASGPARHVIRVVFNQALMGTFDYGVPDELWPVSAGGRIRAPFGRGNKPTEGFCVEVLEDVQKPAERGYRLKFITDVIDDKSLFTKRMLELGIWISDYYFAPPGQTLAAMIPAAVKKGAGVAKIAVIYLLCLPNQVESILSEELKRAKKQQVVFRHLVDSGAFSADKGIEKSELKKATGCSDSVIKSLRTQGIIGMEAASVLKSLPVIPDNYALKTSKKIQLNRHQKSALEYLENELTEARFGVSLLHGVTDSGKTEVYIRAIDKAVQLGKQAIILLPEIALTSQTIQRFSERFEKIAVLHSGLTASQRNSEWQRIVNDEADVIIGARSAVFAPAQRLGLIVVDEEHEASYKQDMVPRYHGRDVAIKRCQLENAHCLLGSATPSLESIYNARYRKHYKLLELPERVMELPMPAMECVDMSSGEDAFSDEILSRRLRDAIRVALHNGEQVILLLNRRGYSAFVFCPDCKEAIRCKNCDVTLTYHKRGGERAGSGILSSYKAGGYAICHHCGSRTLVPVACPLCGKKLVLKGAGSQKLEEELKNKFSGAKVARIDSDSMESADYYQMLDAFSRGDIDILAGTQMLAKGLHFPNVTLVGVLNSDAALAIPDFRSGERTFQLLSQVAGRTGRGEKPGKVIIQTVKPKQTVIQLAMQGDYEGFVNREFEIRRQLALPPFTRMAIARLSDKSFQLLETEAERLFELLGDISFRLGLKITISKPVPSIIPRLHSVYRMDIRLVGGSGEDMRKLLRNAIYEKTYKQKVKIIYDIDPISML
ncbi:Primosomal protein N' [Limihaloglobus sulfuriphilus]|uniref:Replication restart protein PriA n=1 Tax=Limihaloglobus sulfuriphilus TaxID=1851148 RepID=A0A1Q2MAC5_9BACT|nr:primosomal protein N' [Limihaloglobus sulfuriphilus]AQQ69675.1 Primosomal protein N' [Limihaloglobus sulfuriphilus]